MDTVKFLVHHTLSNTEVIRLSSFQWRHTKLGRFLAKNQYPQKELFTDILTCEWGLDFHISKKAFFKYIFSH